MIYNTVTKEWSWKTDGINITADSEEKLIDKIHEFRMECNSRYKYNFINNCNTLTTTGNKPL
jgi:hypothetical protein